MHRGFAALRVCVLWCVEHRCCKPPRGRQPKTYPWVHADFPPEGWFQGKKDPRPGGKHLVMCEIARTSRNPGCYSAFFTSMGEEVTVGSKTQSV